MQSLTLPDRGDLMAGELGFSIPLIFVLSILLGVILYIFGSIIAPKVKKRTGKLAPYACGEDLPAEKLQVNAEEFFIYATYFLIFDVVAFVLATSFGRPGFFPILFIAIILVASVVLFSVRVRRVEKDGFDQVG
jgi:NADH:ubiquinone oxidoreductase subunit 3 (subunit A)